ncbi:MAG TPA: autotransporter domain-containing protein [Rhizobiaceae bacterium]|nr:autotransporter domain-containing protein [Rhizobiaceae bacterium]
MKLSLQASLLGVVAAAGSAPARLARPCCRELARTLLRGTALPCLAAVGLAVVLSMPGGPAQAGGSGGQGRDDSGGLNSPGGAPGQDGTPSADGGGGGGGGNDAAGLSGKGGDGGSGITLGGAAGTLGRSIAGDGTISTAVSGTNGGQGDSHGAGGAGGGGGGLGVLATGGGSLDVNATILGGNGGDGGSGGGGAGGGGGGGDGILATGGGTITINGSVTAGHGGNGGTGGGVAGDGGGAGSGVVLVDGGSLEINAAVTGGNGGAGGLRGDGGAGGTGVVMSAGGMLVINALVTGGAGGAAGAVGPTLPGANGAGVVGSDLDITLGSAGAIVGGGNGAGNAITFQGGSNRLNLISASPSLTGNIAIGGGGSLTIDPAVNATLSNAITGNGSLVKSGSAWLTLTGVSTYSGSTTVDSGTLALAGAGARLGNSGARIDVGGAAPASLVVNDGAQLTSQDGNIGLGGAGSATVIGNNSLWTGHYISAGRLASGDLKILGGGGVAAERGYVGSFATGTATISGAGSRWSNNAGFLVGFGVGSNGSVTVANGGTVQASQIEMGNGGGAGAISVTGSSVSGRGMLETGHILRQEGTATLDFDGGGIRATADHASFLSGFGAGDVTIGAGGLFVDSNGFEIGIPVQVDGAGGLTKLGSGTITLSGTNSYAGGTTIQGGVLQVSSNANLGADAGALTFGGGVLQTTAAFASSRDVVLSGSGTLQTDADLTLTGDISGGGLFTKSGAGMLTLAGNNSNTGGMRVQQGILQAIGGNAIGNQSSVVMLGGMIRLLDDEVVATLSGSAGRVELFGTDLRTSSASAAVTALFEGSIAGVGDFIKDGAHRQVLAGDNSYQGATQILAGTLHAVGTGVDALPDDSAVFIADGAILSLVEPSIPLPGTDSDDETIGSLSGAGRVEVGNRTLTVAGNASTTFSGQVSGAGGSLVKLGGGMLTLSGTNTYTGPTVVGLGELRVNGSLGNTAVSVGPSATLSGVGTIAGPVIVDGRLAPGQSPGTLTVGSLTLGAGSVLDYELGQAGVVGGGINDLIEVTGDLTLDGVLNITDIGGFGPGVYRLINYGGNLVDNGLDLGTLPSAVTAADLTIQTSIDKQVNLVNTAGLVVQFWDGDSGGDANNGAVDGGDGTWTATSSTWTDVDGTVNAAMTPRPGFAIFQGTSGTVTANAGAGALAVTGMHFATDGYRIEGDRIALSGAGGESIVRVGDGTATGAGHTATIAAELTGTSSLVKTDFGKLVLTGDNSYSGGTRIEGGTLSVSRDANLGGAAGALNLNGGTLQNTSGFSTGRAIMLGAGGGTFETGAHLTLAGPISGAGDLTKTGVATLTLTGDNSYGGDTLVESGTLVGSVASIRGNIGNAGTVVFEQAADAHFAGAIVGLGADGAMIKRGAGALTLEGTSTLDWTVEAGRLTAQAARFFGDVTIAGAGDLTFEESANAAYVGVISGDGAFIKAGSGVLTLSDDSSGFIGHTDVMAGTLVVGSGAALGGTIDVLSGATLGGSGTVGTTTVRAGATIAPGNSIGTLAVAGDYRQETGSTYQVEIDPAGNSDRIVISGTATIAGGTAFVVKAPGGYGTGRYTILTADGGVTGNYDALDQNAPFLDLGLAYDPKAIHLDIARNSVSFCDVAVTRNQCAAARGAESTGMGNPVYDAIVGLPDEQAARNAFDQLSGEIHASVKAGLFEDSHFVRDAVNDRIRAAFGAAGSLPVMAYGPDGAQAAAADTDRFAVWSRGYGAWGSFDGDGDAARLDTASGGLFIGADALVGESWRLGLLAGYGHSSFQADGRTSSADVDSYTVALYAGTELGRFGMGDLGLRFGAAHAWHEIDSARNIAFPGFAGRSDASYEARSTQLFGELGYTVQSGGVSFEPFANLAYVALSSDGYGENGSAGLRGFGDDSDLTYTTLGVRAATALDIAGMTGSLHGTLGWRHSFSDAVPLATHAFAGGDAFTVAGVPIARNVAVLEAGFELELQAGARLGMAYQGQFGSGARQNGFNAKLAVSF